MNENEKKLIELSRKLKSKRCMDDLLFYAEAIVRAQTAIKADYGLDYTILSHQYGLTPDGYPAQTAQSGTTQAGA